jgi:uncharacterized protein (TIGR03382 family)
MRRLSVAGLCAVGLCAGLALGASAPAFAQDDTGSDGVAENEVSDWKAGDDGCATAPASVGGAVLGFVALAGLLRRRAR